MPITTIVYHLVNCLIVSCVLYKALKSKPDIKNIIIKPLVCSALMGGVVYFIYSGVSTKIASKVINMGLSIIVGGVIYFVSLIVLKTLSKEEKASIPILNKIFSRF